MDYDIFAGDHDTATKYQIAKSEKYTMDVQTFVVKKLTKTFRKEVK